MKQFIPVVCLCLVALMPTRANAAFIEQAFRANTIGTSGTIEHIFAPFDASLGILRAIQFGAVTTGYVLLDQFQCEAGNVASCGIYSSTRTRLAVEFGVGCCVDSAGHTVLPGVNTGWWSGAVNVISYYMTREYGGLFDLEDFYTTPIVYWAETEAGCSGCSSMEYPLLAQINGSAWVRFDYTPAEIPLSSTLLLSALGLGMLGLSRICRKSTAWVQ